MVGKALRAYDFNRWWQNICCVPDHTKSQKHQGGEARPGSGKSPAGGAGQRVAAGAAEAGQEGAVHQPVTPSFSQEASFQRLIY